VLGDWAELEYVGPARTWEKEILRGSHEQGQFTRFYLDGAGAVKAALTVGRPDDLEHASRMIAAREPLSSSDQAALAEPQADLAAILPAGE
jgi:3-phenylpropionate/trans-cinnamate dioxygenase ferredoxin reductase component